MGISAHLLKGEGATFDWPLTSVPPPCAQSPSNVVMLDAQFWWDDVIKFWLRQTVCLLKQWKTVATWGGGGGWSWLWSRSCMRGAFTITFMQAHMAFLVELQVRSAQLSLAPWWRLHAFICLLTAALRVGVQLQSCNVSVPAHGMNEPWVWGPAEQRKGFLVSLGGTETSQVAAWGEVVVQSGPQRRLLVYLQQEAKLKGCRKRGQMVGHHYRLHRYLATVKWPQQTLVTKKWNLIMLKLSWLPADDRIQHCGKCNHDNILKSIFREIFFW